MAMQFQLSWISWSHSLKKRDGQHKSDEKKTGCLGYMGDYITQLYREYNKPL